MKRTLTLLLALAMLFTIGSMTAFAADDLSETFDITWMPAGGSGSYVQLDSITEQWLEARYNVNLTIYQVQANNGEQANLMLASNDMPDCAFLYKSVNDMYDTGLIRSIPLNMIREYMPDYAAFLDENPYGWAINKYPDGNGGLLDDEYGAISGYNGANKGYHWSPMFRYDWLETLGIEAPGEVIELTPGIYWTPASYTLDQFNEIVELMRNEDPDGNGVKDTYGLSGTLSSVGEFFNYTLTLMGGAFGLRNYNNFMEDGVIKPYYVSDAYKQTLDFLSDLAQEDCLDPEIITQDYTAYWEKFASGAVGTMILNRTYLETRFSDRPPYSLISRNADAKILVTGPVVNDEGFGGAPAYNDIPFSYTTFISAKVDDAKLARILTMLNDITSDAETFVTVTYGFPGETFSWEGEEWNSACMLNSSMSTETKGLYAIESYSVFCRRPEFVKFMNNEAITTLYNYATSEEGMNMTFLGNEYIDPANKFKAERDEWNDFYGSEASSIRDKYVSEALTGADVEATWDAYIDELNTNANFQAYMDLIAKYDSAVEFYGLSGLNVGE